MIKENDLKNQEAACIGFLCKTLKHNVPNVIDIAKKRCDTTIKTYQARQLVDILLKKKSVDDHDVLDTVASWYDSVKDLAGQ